LSNAGWTVSQIPALSFDQVKEDYQHPAIPQAKNAAKVGTASRLIRDHVAKFCQPDNFPLILGGDHCVAIGTISGIKSQRPNNAIVWVDAHADINTPETTNSGNMHGMPLGFLLGLVKNARSLPNFDWFTPCVKPEEVVYIGLRDLDMGERRFIKNLGIKAFSMHEVDKLGIGKVMEQTLDHIKNKDIHLSFDIDGLDPFFAPHTGTAVTGGLTFREGNFICEALAETGHLTSMELVEVDPMLREDINPERTIDCAITLIGSAMGKRIL
jgi:arginase